MADVKRLLRQAKESAKEGDWQSVLSHCREVLRENKNSYEAYIFVGKAAFNLREYQQAEAAYTRAASLDPTNVLAWQGLGELYTEIGAHDQAGAAYEQLATLTAACAEPGVSSRSPGYLRKAGEQYFLARQYHLAEAAWRQLLAQAPEGAEGRLELLCRLADAQLAAEQVALDLRLAQYIEEAEAQGQEVNIAAARDAEEALVAEEEVLGSALASTASMGSPAAVTLREIIALVPPSPPYAVYYEAYLRRLRKAAHAAPAGSMERHSRRAAVLHFALTAMKGGGGGCRGGGCCTPLPYEYALSMLEVESDVAGAGGAVMAGSMGGQHAIAAAEAACRAAAERAAVTGELGGHSPSAGGAAQAGPELQIQAMEHVTQRMVHAFPWAPAAGVHLALSLRRRGGPTLDSTATSLTKQHMHHSPGAGHDLGPEVVTQLGSCLPPPERSRRLGPPERRRRLIQTLLKGLRGHGVMSYGVKGVSSAAGWIAASELLMDEGDPDSALEAAKQGLTYTSARELLGHEALAQADLLLKLAAGRALAAMGGAPSPFPCGHTPHILNYWRLQQQQQSEFTLQLQGQSGSAGAGSSPSRSISLDRNRSHTSGGSGGGAGGASSHGGAVPSSSTGHSSTHLGTSGGSTAVPPQAVPIPSLTPAQLAAAEEAEKWLSSLLLGGKVGSGVAPFAVLAGSPTMSDIPNQATRCLAQVALARGDAARARALYEGLMGAVMLGRGGAAADHWAAAEYGALLLLFGEAGAALPQAELALQALEKDAPPAVQSSPSPGCPVQSGSVVIYNLLMARYLLLAGYVCWEMGGEHRSTRGSHAHQFLLKAAAAAESAGSTCAVVHCGDVVITSARSSAAEAFALLGQWYTQCGGDVGRAVRCFERALALDPGQAEAGLALLSHLVATGNLAAADALCEDTLARTAATATAAAAPGAPEGAVGNGSGGSTGWALRTRPWLRLRMGDAEGAVQGYLRAVRLDPSSAPLWEGLGAAYQTLGRHTAALKSYGRALELEPGRLYCLVQQGALQYQMGAFTEAVATYTRALQVSPTHPAALLGCAEALLASAHAHTRSGAPGVAAVELSAAAEHARGAAQTHSSLEAAWKLLGDVLLQYAGVTPVPELRALRSAKPGGEAAEAAVQAVRARQRQLRAARAAYAHALHLDPSQGLVWGDAAMALHQHASLDTMLRASGAQPSPLNTTPYPTDDGASNSGKEGIQPLGASVTGPSVTNSVTNDSAVTLLPTPAVWKGGPSTKGRPIPGSHGAAVHRPPSAVHGTVAAPGGVVSGAGDNAGAGGWEDAARSAARFALTRGIAVEPTSDWLWACAGAFAAGDAAALAASAPSVYALPHEQHRELLARAEYCMTRALQLNPKRAATWAALGRLYAEQGAGPLAERCFEQCRSLEPTLVSVWEGMGHLAGRNSQGPGDHGYRAMLDAYEHAVGLGGGTESRLGYAAGALLAGRGSEGEVTASAAKAASHQPLLATAHATLGLALEARGQYSAAVNSYRTALELLARSQSAGPSQGHAPGGASAVINPYEGLSLQAAASLGRTMTAAVALPQKVIPPAGGSAAVDASQQAAFGGDVSTSLTSTMADPAGAQAVRLAVTLNLARALIRSGTKEGAGEAVQIYASLEAGGSTTLDADPPSLVAYAAALEATGKPDQALSTLERAVERVSTDGQKSDRARLTFVLALARAYISKGRVGDAYALVLAHTCDLVSPGNQPPGSGTTPEADLAVQLWAAVLVGAASDVLPGVGAVPAVHAGQKVELEEVAAALLSWAGARSDVGQAEVSALVDSVRAARAAASGEPLTALRSSARAVHTCPWDPRLRARLAASSSRVPPGAARASATARVMPTLVSGYRSLTPGSLMSRKGHEYLSQMSPGQEDGHSFPPPLLTPASYKALAAPAPSVLGAAIPGASGTGNTPAGGTVEDDPYTVRAAALLALPPTGEHRHSFEAEVAGLGRLVHEQPASSGAWLLLALMSAQLAAASGGQSALWRRAMVRCRHALKRVQNDHQRAVEAQAASAAESAAQPAAAAPPPSVVVLHPAFMHLPAAAAPQQPSPAKPGPQSPAQAAAAAAVTPTATAVLRLMAILSEATLHSRLPGCETRAKDIATESLRWALQNQLSTGLAHRALARCAVASGDIPNAEHAYSQAIKAGDPPSLLEYATLLVKSPASSTSTSATTPVPPDVLSHIQAAVASAASAPGVGPEEQALLAAAAALGPVAAKMGIAGGAEGGGHWWDEVRSDLEALVKEEGQLPPGALPAAHVLQSQAALHVSRQAAAGGDDAAAKRSVLEARWAASTAGRLLSTQDGGGSHVLLEPEPPIRSRGVAVTRVPATTQLPPSSTRGLALTALAAAEAARGKMDKAVEAQQRALHDWAPPPAPASLLGVLSDFKAAANAGQAAADALSARRAAVHMCPWEPANWQRLRVK